MKEYLTLVQLNRGTMGGSDRVPFWIKVTKSGTGYHLGYSEGLSRYA